MKAKTLQEANERIAKLEVALKSIVSGGEWLVDLYKIHDENLLPIVASYATGCYRMAKNVL